MSEESEEVTFIESIIEAVEGTKSTAELTFDSLTITLPWIGAKLVINGTINFTARPIHERNEVVGK